MATNPSEGAMDTLNPEWVTKSNKRGAGSPPTYNTDGKRVRKGDDPNQINENIVYINGKNVNLTKINPIKIKKDIIDNIGAVDNIFITSKKFLKIYCKT
jgi:hypothetical protein